MAAVHHRAMIEKDVAMSKAISNQHAFCLIHSMRS